MNIREPLVRLSVVYAGTLFPFRIEALAEVLPQLGFVVEDARAAPRFGGRLGMAGVLGTKGDVNLLVSSDRRSVGVEGRQNDVVVRGFETIEEALHDRLGFPSRERGEYYELLAQLFVDSAEKRPLAETEKHFEELPSLGRFGTVLGGPVANFGFRLVPRGLHPNAPNWFDIRIEPEVLQPDRLYFLDIVFREPDRAAVLGVANRVLTLAKELIAIVEGRSK